MMRRLDPPGPLRFGVSLHLVQRENPRVQRKARKCNGNAFPTDPAMIARARALLARYEEMWRARIDRLDALLAEPETPPSSTPTPPPASTI